jgi:hypothetical protein
VAVFERVRDGHTPGSVARWLNGEGVETARATAFTQRSIRKIIGNDSYQGRNGYPRIVSDELAEAARASIVRLDPAEIQRRKGGRPSKVDYMLRSMVFCTCGAPMYPTRSYGRGRGAYACSHKLQATGVCDRPAIPADVLETHVLNHLGSFVGEVKGWLGDILTQRSLEAQARAGRLDVERDALVALDRQRDERMAELMEVGITAVGMEVIEAIDRKREAQARRIAEAQAALGEWSGAADVDAVLDFYNRLSEIVRGRLDQAADIREINEGLHTVVSGMWCELRDDRLSVRFALRQPDDGEGEMWLSPKALGRAARIGSLDDASIGVRWRSGPTGGRAPDGAESTGPDWTLIEDLDDDETMQLTNVSACWP